MLLKIALVLAGLTLAFAVYLFALGQSSRSGAPPGMTNGSLAACPDTPNCVCSEQPAASAHFIEPLPMTGANKTRTISALTAAVDALGGQVTSLEDDYLSVTFTSRLFRFVDDVEFRIDAASELVHVRSASRVGRSDLGVNRKRVESIREFLLDR